MAATAAHWLATAWLMALVVRDALVPGHDPVRTDGFDEDLDDPGGGVLDRAGGDPSAGEPEGQVEEVALSR